MQECTENAESQHRGKHIRPRSAKQQIQGQPFQRPTTVVGRQSPGAARGEQPKWGVCRRGRSGSEDLARPGVRVARPCDTEGRVCPRALKALDCAVRI